MRLWVEKFLNCNLKGSNGFKKRLNQRQKQLEKQGAGQLEKQGAGQLEKQEAGQLEKQSAKND